MRLTLKQRLWLLYLHFKIIISAITLFVLGTLVSIFFANFVYGVTLGTETIEVILAIQLAISIIQWLASPYIISRAFTLHEVKPDDPEYGWLASLVAEVAKKNKMSPPKVYVAYYYVPNAFAFASPIGGKRIAITSSAIKILNKDELKAVIAHELGHLKHHDVELLLAVGLIPSLVYYLGRSMIDNAPYSKDATKSVLSGIVLILASLVFSLIVLYINRLREIYADINSALTVEDGAKNLQLALAKIIASTSYDDLDDRFNGTTLMLFFNSHAIGRKESVEELIESLKSKKVDAIDELLSTHPHPAKRIQILEKFN